jgi:hypothetical protein
VLHDFDRSGFSICGTLGADSRRYVFENNLKTKFVDIGLRLADVEAMGLQSEPVAPMPRREWAARAETLRRHGATPEEIEFLREGRVELNAMTSRQLVDFIEAKLREYGVKKVIPDDDVLERQARRCIEQRMIAEAISKARKKIAGRVKKTLAPEGLRQKVPKLLERSPRLPWDIAVARIVAGDGAAAAGGEEP